MCGTAVVQVKSHIYQRGSAITSRDFNTDPLQRRGAQRFFFSLTYVNSVLKSSIKCRNCCLVVRFFQIAPLQSQCLIPHLIVGENLCHHLCCVPIPASLGRQKGGGRSVGSWGAAALWSLLLSAERPKGAI